MPRKGYSTEQIVTKLRQAEIELGRGVRPPLVCKTLGVSEQTYSRWRRDMADGGSIRPNVSRSAITAIGIVRIKRNAVVTRFNPFFG